MITIWAPYALYNRLANEKLYEACAALTDEERRRDLGAFFKSVHGTLNHLLLGDRIWMTRFEGGSHPSTNLDAILFESFAELRQARADMDRRIEALFSALPADFLKRTLSYVNNAGVASEDPADVIVPHFLQSSDPSSRAGPHAPVATRPRAAVARPAPRAE